MSYVDNFINTVIEKSAAITWDDAKKEWNHTHTYENPGSVCICGKEDITDVCVIENYKTGEVLHVGNQCVKKVGVHVDDEFRWIKGKRESIPESILKRAVANKIIKSPDYLFYINIQSKRRLTIAQTKWKNDIEYKIKEYMKKKIVDKTAFEYLETFQDEHRKILMNHLRNLLLKLNSNDIRVSEALNNLANITKNVSDLKKHYKQKITK